MSVAPPLKKRPTWNAADDGAAVRERVGLDLGRVLARRVGERILADPCHGRLDVRRTRAEKGGGSDGDGGGTARATPEDRVPHGPTLFAAGGAEGLIRTRSNPTAERRVGRVRRPERDPAVQVSATRQRAPRLDSGARPPPVNRRIHPDTNWRDWPYRMRSAEARLLHQRRSDDTEVAASRGPPTLLSRTNLSSPLQDRSFVIALREVRERRRGANPLLRADGEHARYRWRRVGGPGCRVRAGASSVWRWPRGARRRRGDPHEGRGICDPIGRMRC